MRALYLIAQYPTDSKGLHSATVRPSARQSNLVPATVLSAIRKGKSETETHECAITANNKY